jgi:hypothetical protein
MAPRSKSRSKPATTKPPKVAALSGQPPKIKTLSPTRVLLSFAVQCAAWWAIYHQLQRGGALDAATSYINVYNPMIKPCGLLPHKEFLILSDAIVGPAATGPGYGAPAAAHRTPADCRCAVPPAPCFGLSKPQCLHLLTDVQFLLHTFYFHVCFSFFLKRQSFCFLGCDRDRYRTKAVREAAGECVRLSKMVRGCIHVHVVCVCVRAWCQRCGATRPHLLGTFTTILFSFFSAIFFLRKRNHRERTESNG